MSRNKINTVLFDLDGTFADTAPDLAYALNVVLQRHNKSTLTLEQIRPVVSHGGAALIELGFNISVAQPEFEPLRMELLDIYRDNLVQQNNNRTQLFPNMDNVLHYITEQQLNWGIVTNKPGWLTDPLMQGLDLPSIPACIISGDTLPQRKPDPAQLIHACEIIGTTPSQSVYIGDAERDIEAGNRAGMLTLVALFGYIANDDEPGNWNADEMLHNVTDIKTWLQEHV